MARPIFLPGIAKDLSARAKNDWKKNRIGYVLAILQHAGSASPRSCRYALIALSAFEQLVEACSNADGPTDTSALAVFEEYVVDMIQNALMHVNTEVRAAGARLCAKFIAGQDILVDQARLATFMVPLLTIVASMNIAFPSPADVAALRALNQLISKFTPQALVDNVHIIVPVIIPVLHRVIALAATTAPGGSSPPGARDVYAGSLVPLLEEIISIIGMAINPAIASGIFAPFLSYFDDHNWQPVEVVNRVIRLLDTNSSTDASKATFPGRTDVFSPSTRKKAGAYAVPMFIVIIRHISKVDDYFTAVASALMLSGKVPTPSETIASSPSGPAVTPQLPASLPSVPNPSMLSGSRQLGRQVVSADVPAADWLPKIRASIAKGMSLDEAAAALAASSPPEYLACIEREFTILRHNIVCILTTLLADTPTSLSSYSHDLLDCLVPFLFEPSEVDMGRTASASLPGELLHAAVDDCFTTFFTRISLSQHVLRFLSDICEWYLNHVLEYATALFQLPGSDANGKQAFHHTSSSSGGFVLRFASTRRNTQTESGESPHISLVTSPSNITAAAASRRLSRQVVSALAAVGVTSASTAPGAEPTAAMNIAAFVAQTERHAYSARQRLMNVILKAAMHFRQVSISELTTGAGAHRQHVPKALCMALEACIVEPVAKLRATGLVTLHELLCSSEPQNSCFDGTLAWRKWVARHTDVAIVGGGSEPLAPGWLQGCIVSSEQALRIPPRQLSRLLSALYHSVTIAIGADPASCISTAAPIAEHCEAHLALISLVLRDTLKAYGIEGIWKVVPFAHAIQAASMGIDPSKPVSAEISEPPRKQQTTVGDLTCIPENESTHSLKPPLLWTSLWPLAHALGLSVVQMVGYALDNLDVTEYADVVHASRMQSGKSESDRVSISKDGLLGPATTLAQPLGIASDIEGDVAVDFSLMATFLMADPAVRNTMSEYGMTEGSSSARAPRGSILPSPYRSPLFGNHDATVNHSKLASGRPEMGFGEGFENVEHLRSALAASFVVAPKDAFLREAAGVDAAEKPEVRDVGGAFSAGEEDDSAEEGVELAETATTSGVSSVFRRPPASEGRPLDVEKILSQLLRPTEEVASALSFERSMAKFDPRNALHSHERVLLGPVREPPAVKAALDPWRQAPWLHIATDPATFWELEVAHEVAEREHHTLKKQQLEAL